MKGEKPGPSRRPARSSAATMTAVVALAASLYLISLFNYLLFHTLIELMAIITSALFFMVALIGSELGNSRLPFLLACGFFWSAVIDLVHTLAYKGMGVFPGYTANLPTQLWILARYLESLVILGSVIWFGRPVRHRWIPAGGIGLLAAIGISLVFLGLFPTAYVEGKGLTQFKITSEYVIVAILLCSAVIIWAKRALLHPWTFQWLVTAIAFTILAELSFTRYVSVYGFFNALGHIFKFIAYAAMFHVVIRNMLELPLQLVDAVVPLCARCKAIRVAQDTWTTVEEFLESKSGKMVSHGLCPSCYKALLEELETSDGLSQAP